MGHSSLIPRQKYIAKAANLGPDEVEYDGVTYKICTAEHGALSDHGTNGGIAGANCQVIKTADQVECYINIEGIGDHMIAKRHLVLVHAITQSNQGPVIVLMHQYALVEDGTSIHSSLQME
jgi:hypothetical protein